MCSRGPTEPSSGHQPFDSPPVYCSKELQYTRAYLARVESDQMVLEAAHLVCESGVAKAIARRLKRKIGELEADERRATDDQPHPVQSC